MESGPCLRKKGQTGWGEQHKGKQRGNKGTKSKAILASAVRKKEWVCGTDHRYKVTCTLTP